MPAAVRSKVGICAVALVTAWPLAAAAEGPAATPAPAAADDTTQPAPPPAPRPRARKVRARARAAGPIATFPGFELLADGGSRLFVALTQSVNVEEKRAARRLTYVLKGAHVVRRNNENALVTLHFNTPVSRARLLPSGGDLAFIVELRADSSPSWKVVDAKDGTAILQIDFPKGSFLPANGQVNDNLPPAPVPGGNPPKPPSPPPSPPGPSPEPNGGW